MPGYMYAYRSLDGVRLDSLTVRSSREKYYSFIFENFLVDENNKSIATCLSISAPDQISLMSKQNARKITKEAQACKMGIRVVLVIQILVYLHKTSRATCKHQLEWPQGKQRASIKGTGTLPRPLKVSSLKLTALAVHWTIYDSSLFVWQPTSQPAINCKL